MVHRRKVILRSSADYLASPAGCWWLKEIQRFKLQKISLKMTLVFVYSQCVYFLKPDRSKNGKNLWQFAETVKFSIVLVYWHPKLRDRSVDHNCMKCYQNTFSATDEANQFFFKGALTRETLARHWFCGAVATSYRKERKVWHANDFEKCKKKMWMRVCLPLITIFTSLSLFFFRIIYIVNVFDCRVFF